MAILKVRDLALALAKLEEQGHGSLPVMIDKTSFYHPEESSGCQIIGLHGASRQTCSPVDDDGCRPMLMGPLDPSDKKTRRVETVVLFGCSGISGQRTPPPRR